METPSWGYALFANPPMIGPHFSLECTRSLMKRSLTLLAVVIAVAAGAGYWYVQGKLPQREGEVAVAGLQAPVSVRYDARGVPHLQAQSEPDLYRALGYVHAQDRLFQMEIMRRLARGELAEVLGDKLLPTDTLFRSLRIREQAALMASARTAVAGLAGPAGLPRWGQPVAGQPPQPMEFDLLGITRPFTAEDTLSIAGYLAYSFAAAFRTEPALTYIRDQLGADYLKIFDLDWQPEGAWARRWPPPTGKAWKHSRASARGPGRRRHPAVRRQQRLGGGRQPHPQWQAVAGGRPAHQLRGAGVVRGRAVGASTCTATSRRSTRSPCWATTVTSAGA
jgi:hypothetical protein